jgi:hypothetical protein
MTNYFQDDADDEFDFDYSLEDEALVELEDLLQIAVEALDHHREDPKFGLCSECSQVFPCRGAKAFGLIAKYWTKNK